MRAALVHTEPIFRTKYQGMFAAEAARGSGAPRTLASELVHRGMQN